MNRWIRRYWFCFVPFILAEIVDWTAYTCASGMADRFVDIPDNGIAFIPRGHGLSAFTAEFPQLSYWAASAMILGLFGLFLIAFANLSIVENLHDRPRKIRATVLGIIWGFCVVYIGVCGALGLFTDLSPRTTNIILDKVAELLEWESVELLGTLGNLLAFAVMWALVAAFGALLAPPAEPVSGGAKDCCGWRLDDIEELATRMSRARVLLYLSGLFLMVGVFQIASTNRLALPWVSDGDGKLLSILATHYAALAGAVFTLVLVTFYVPTQYFLSKRAEELSALARPYGNAKQRGDWLDMHDLKVSLKSQTSTVLAALAPLFGSGPLKTLVDYAASAS